MGEFGQFQSNINVPLELKTQFQMFGSLFEDPFEQHNQSQKNGSNY